MSEHWSSLVGSKIILIRSQRYGRPAVGTLSGTTKNTSCALDQTKTQDLQCVEGCTARIGILARLTEPVPRPLGNARSSLIDLDFFSLDLATTLTLASSDNLGNKTRAPLPWRRLALQSLAKSPSTNARRHKVRWKTAPRRLPELSDRAARGLDYMRELLQQNRVSRRESFYEGNDSTRLDLGLTLCRSLIGGVKYRK